MTVDETAAFDRDDHPGAPRILFLGSAAGTHSHAWIQLLDGAAVNARLFSPFSYDLAPPDAFAYRTWLTLPGLSLDTANRRNLLGPAEPAARAEDRLLQVQLEACHHAAAHGYAALRAAVRGALLTVRADAEYRGDRYGQAREQLREFRRSRLQRLRHMTRQFRRLLAPLPVPPCLLQGEPVPWVSPEVLPMPQPDLPPDGPVDAESALLRVLEEWPPDIVHTFGFFEAGRWFHDIHRRHRLGSRMRWVMQFRGGSDLTIRRHLPSARQAVEAAARDADSIVNDNLTERDYLRAWDIPASRFAAITPVPGSGGMTVPASLAALPPPSARNVILWPKAYTTQTAQGLPVLEALKLAWDRLPPCRIVMLWADQPDFREWVETLPRALRAVCELHGRVPREQVFALMGQARVLLAPSLVDGRPNVVFEAWAHGAFPVVSPLSTIAEFVRAPENALFARNLYPAEIADALVRAMTDDALVDTAATANLTVLRQVADRDAIAPRVLKFYMDVAAVPREIEDTAMPREFEDTTMQRREVP